LQEYTINDILKIFLKRWWLFVIGVIICGTIGFGYTKFFIPKTYISKGMIYVNNKDNRFSQNLTNGANLNDLYVAERLSESFRIILKTDKFLNYVLEDTGLDYTTNMLSSMLSVTTSEETEIINISVVCEDPALANKIVTSVLLNAKTQLSDILEVGHIKIIEDASFNPKHIGPNLKLNTFIGMFIGAMLIAAFVLFKELTNTTIVNESDIELNFEVPLIGIIPDLNEAIFEDSYYSRAYK